MMQRSGRRGGEEVAQPPASPAPLLAASPALSLASWSSSRQLTVAALVGVAVLQSLLVTVLLSRAAGVARSGDASVGLRGDALRRLGGADGGSFPVHPIAAAVRRGAIEWPDLQFYDSAACPLDAGFAPRTVGARLPADPRSQPSR